MREPLGVVGLRERWRMHVKAVPAQVPLRGFVELAWGEGPSVGPVPPARRVARLVEHRVIHRLPPRDPALLLELAALPMLELRRPRDWDAAAGARSACLTPLSPLPQRPLPECGGMANAPASSRGVQLFEAPSCLRGAGDRCPLKEEAVTAPLVLVAPEGQFVNRPDQDQTRGLI